MAQDHVVYRTGFAVNPDGTPVSPEELERCQAVFNKALGRCFLEMTGVIKGREFPDVPVIIVPEGGPQAERDRVTRALAKSLSQSKLIAEAEVLSPDFAAQKERALADLEAALAADSALWCAPLPDDTVREATKERPSPPK